MNFKKSIKIASAVAGFAAFALVSFQAYAVYRMETYTTYYSNASLTTEVGYTVIHCNGTSSRSGTRTAYYTVEKEPCCGNYLC